MRSPTAKTLSFSTLTMILLSSAALVVSAQAPNRAAARERSGEEIVRAQCANCHESGKGAAPKIGDRSAWIARAKQGLDALVNAAMKGTAACRLAVASLT